MDKRPKRGVFVKKRLDCGELWVIDWCQWVIVGSHEEKQTPLEAEQKGMATVDYFERKLDDKRRLSLPTEIRAEFESGVVVTRGFSNYLHLYPKAVWDLKVEPSLAGDILDERIADLNVQFRTGKTETVIDQKQGRFTLEQHLLDYAKIKRDLTAVRVGQYWRLLPK